MTERSMQSRMDRLARAYPVALPAIGLALSAGAAVALLMAPSEHGKLLSLLAGAGALTNAVVLLRNLRGGTAS